MPTDTYYTVKQSSLTAVANAIREKSGTSESLSFPNGFTTAINTISTGGSGTTYIIDVNMSYGSITSYDLHSATAAGISSALSADPETKIILRILVDEEATPAVVVPSLGNRANEEFSAIYMRALFSALDYSIGDVYGYDITLRLNANGLDVMNYQSTAY